MTDNAQNIGGGPSKDTLRLLKDFLPSLKKGLKDGTLRGKGKPGMIRRPRKLCRVCGQLWDYINMPAGSNSKVTGELCVVCEPKLKSGMIAITYSDKFAFVESSSGDLADFKGTILHVSEPVWAEIEKQFKEKVNTKANKEQSENNVKN
jgi:hypothetical protein